MKSSVFKEKDVEKAIQLLGGARLTEVSVTDYFSEISCDKYDCFFRDVQCPCEGICDGRQ